MQDSLFNKFSDNEIKKLSNRADPETSREAIEELMGSGKHAQHMAIVFKAVRDNPGLTATELMGATGLGEYQVRRRLTDLKNKGYIRRGDPRSCTVKGSRMVVWVANAQPKGE